MLKGLEGRRLAVFVSRDDAEAEKSATIVRTALQAAGAHVHLLSAADAKDTDFLSSASAGLVAVGGAREFRGDPRVVQLTREYLASDKPVAVLGSAVAIVLAAGGAAARTMACPGSMRPALESAGAQCVQAPVYVDDGLISANDTSAQEFANQLVRTLSTKLEEREVDTASELSFPASDPPAL